MKAKIKLNIEVEYELLPESFPEYASSPEKMLEMDLAYAVDDPISFIEATHSNWMIVGELVPEEDEDGCFDWPSVCPQA